MKKTPAGRVAFLNIEIVAEYLVKHETASFRDMVRSELLETRAIREALKYGIRHGIIVSEKRVDAAPDERTQYRLTGRPLTGDRVPSFSFDALLHAWGMMCEIEPSETTASGRRFFCAS